MKRNSALVQWTPATIVFIYLLLGCFWILLSDEILIDFVGNKDALAFLQRYKSWFYVFLTGAMLYVLIQSGIKTRRENKTAQPETQKSYDELAENANVCIFTLNAGGNFTAVNRAVEKITGYSREELLKLNFNDLLAPESRDYVNHLLDTQNNLAPFNEVKIIGKHGQRIFLEISSWPLSLKGSTSIENIARDVTPRHLMQAALQETELRYKDLVETANEGIWTVDADFRVTLINPKMCELMGYRAEEILGNPLIDFFDDDVKKQREERTLRRREGVCEQEDLRFTRPDGKQIWLLISSNPIIHNGKFQGVLYMATDITARKNAEQNLRESEERFRILFERSAIGAMLVLEGGQIFDCNEIGAEMLGYTREELKKLTVFDIDALLSREEILKVEERAFARPARIQFETLHRTKSGELKNVLVAVASLQIEGENCGFASFLDISDKKQAEEALQREKERLEKIAIASPSVIHSFRYTAEGNPQFTFSSPAIYEIYGKSPEELETDGSLMLQLTHPEDLPRLEMSVKKSAETMSVLHETWRVNNPQKGEIWVEAYSAPVREADGTIIWHGILNDVTERMQKEKEISERERMLTGINNAAPSMIMLWDLRSGRVLYINKSIEQILDYTPEEMYAMSRDEIFSNFHPEDLPRSLEFVKEIMVADDGEILTNEYRWLDKSGKWRLLRSRNIIFERDAEGTVIKTLSVIDDVTERRLVVEALRKSEERLRKLHRIVSNSDLNHSEIIRQLLRLGIEEFGVEQAILGEVKDQTYCVVEAVSPDNPIPAGFACSLSETLCKEILGKKDLLAIENVGASRWRESLAYKTFGSEVFIGIPVHNSGKIYGTVCFTGKKPRAVPFSSGDKEFLKLVAQWISGELTRQAAEEALRESEEQLLQAQKLESVGRLAGGISHDFNNMLTAINGYSDLILGRIEETNPLRRSVEEIKKAGERSADLTQQLLAFSRQQILKPEILDINQTVSDISNLLERLIGEDISLIKILDPAAKSVEVDHGRLSQMIVNLAVNARDAMPQGGALTIETKNVYFDEQLAKTTFGAKGGEFVMLSVEDTGLGMDEATLNQVFEPFFTTKEVGKGTGLGLASVYGFIKQSEGYITVDSCPAEGTTFKIFLPCAEEFSEKEVEETSRENSKRGAETILLVEDEEMVRNLSRTILESCGYRVIEASSGAEALEVCKENNLQIDLLLTDVVMPGMNGRELWEKLARSCSGIKVIFTSGYTDDMVVRRGVANDEANFLQKPFSIDDLTQKVREVLDAEDH